MAHFTRSTERAHFGLHFLASVPGIYHLIGFFFSEPLHSLTCWQSSLLGTRYGFVIFCIVRQAILSCYLIIVGSATVLFCLLQSDTNWDAWWYRRLDFGPFQFHSRGFSFTLLVYMSMLAPRQPVS